MSSLNLEEYEVLNRDIHWGPVTAKFELTHLIEDESLVSNVSIIPFIGDQCVMIQLEDGRWELIGGTLEPKESYKDALKRELMEEAGAELTNYRIFFGQFRCTSCADSPFRPHIPHPDFIRAVVFGDVKIVGKPLNPEDGEKIAKVEAVDLDEAVRRLEEIRRYDIADLYRLAHRIRGSEQRFLARKG